MISQENMNERLPVYQGVIFYVLTDFKGGVMWD